MGRISVGMGRIPIGLGRIPLGLGQNTLCVGMISLWLCRNSAAWLWVVDFEDFLTRIDNLFWMSHRWTEKSRNLKKILEHVNSRYLY